MGDGGSSKQRDRAATAGEPPRAPASGTARDRRRAEREVRRALSESRAVVLWACFIVSSHVAGFALLAGNGVLLLAGGPIAFAFFVALCAHAEPPPERGPKGEIALMPEPQFELLLASVEREAELLAGSGAAPRAVAAPALDADSFACLVGEALDDLPPFLRAEVEHHVPVVISDDGRSHSAHGCYGLYMGATVANRGWGSRIVIFRDMLLRDFGGDPEMLRRRVTMVVRHELAHHLGAGERAVSDLDLYDLTGPRAPKPYADAARLARPAAARAVVPRRAVQAHPPRRAGAVAWLGDGSAPLRPASRPPAATPWQARWVVRPPQHAPHPARPPPQPPSGYERRRSRYVSMIQPLRSRACARTRTISSATSASAPATRISSGVPRYAPQ